MVYSDCVNRVVGQTQNYDMARTLPLLPVAVHLLMACNAPMQLKYPHSQFEVRLKHDSILINVCKIILIRSTHRCAVLN